MYDHVFSRLGREDKQRYLSHIQDELAERRASKAATRQAAAQLPAIKPGLSLSDEPFDLSDIQEAYLVGRLIENKAACVGCHSYMEIEVGTLDVDALNIAWNRLVQHHLMLHTVIMSQGKQKPLKSIPHCEFEIHDLIRETPAGIQAHLERMRLRMSHKIYLPDRWPFFEIAVTITAKSRAIIHFSIDMMIADAASLQLLMRQWFQLYRRPETELRALSITFMDYIKAIKAFEQSDRFKTDMSYWIKRLEHMPVESALSSLLRRDPVANIDQTRRKRLAYELKPHQWDKLGKRAQQLNITPTALLLTLFGQAFQQGSENGSFAVVITYFNRPPLHPQIDSIVGPFISTSIFTVDRQPDLTMQDKAHHLQQQLWNDLDHMSVSGIQVLRRLKAMGMVKADVVIPVVFTSVMGASDAEGAGLSEGMENSGGLSHNIIYSVSQTPQVLLDHQIIREQDCLHLSWDVAIDHFQVDAIERLFRIYCRLIETALDETEFWRRTAFDDICQADGKPGGSPTRPLPSLCRKRDLPSGFTIAPDPASRYEPFALTDQQSAYLFGRASIGSVGNFSCQAYQEFDITDLDLTRLHFAINTLIELHDMLRCVVSAEGFQRIIVVQRAYTVTVHDLTYQTNDKTEQHLEALRRRMSSQVRPLDQWPLFDFQVTHIDKQTSRLHIVIDLLIMDGNSIQLFFHQLFALYCSGSGTVPVPTITFRDYMTALEQFRETPAYGEALNYWEQKFARIAPAPVLKGSKEIPQAGVLTRLRLENCLVGWLEIKQKAEQLGVPPAMVLLAAYGEVLAHFTPGEPFSIVVANWDRLPLHADIDSVLGDFTAMSWVVITPAPKSFADKVVAVHAANEEDLAQLPVSGLQALRKQAFKKNNAVAAGFPMVFTNFLSQSDYMLPDTIEAVYGLSHTPQVYLDNMAIDHNDHLLFSWDVLQEKFDHAQIENMFGCYCRLLEQLAAEPETWYQTDFNNLFTTKRVCADDEEKLFQKMQALNDTAAAYENGRCLHAYIEDQVVRTPEQPALVFDGRTMTYAQFNAHANQWARHLKRLGSGPDRIIAVMMQRSFEMVIALHAVLKAGGAYLPIDPGYPEERIAFILKDADVEIILTQKRYRTKCDRWGKKVLCLEADTDLIKNESTQNLTVSTQPDHLAYVIYTSGSTGKPKGCMISHKAICNRLFWMQETYRLNSSDRVLQKTPFTFDVSVWEFFWPFLGGATLVIAKPGGHQDSHYLVDFIQQQEITVLHFVPSMLRFFINEKEVARCTSLKKIFTSGEALSYTLMDKTLCTLKAELHNLYGPTEAAVDVSYWHCQRRSDRIVPIGKPVANTQLYILSKDLKPLPLGETGELFIGGVQLARGYLNRSELTRERFVDNPFDPGTRLYRTGDQARYLPDGNIEFLGRLDFQVKLRGLRIELGEIEHQLLCHEGITEAAVLVQDQNSEDPKLVAYTVSKQTPPPESKTVKQSLKVRLPSYMVPNYIVAMDELPTTIHGKLDRKALPWPIESARQTKECKSAEEYKLEAAPQAVQSDRPLENAAVTKSLEQVTADITAIFKKVLNIDTIDPADDIFDHGATSLTLLNAIQKINDAYDVSALEIGKFMEKPCIEAFVAHIRKNPQAGAHHSSANDCLINTDSAGTAPPETARPDGQPDVDSFNRIEMLKTPGEEIVVDLNSISFSQDCYRRRQCRRSFTRRTFTAESFGAFLSLLKMQSGKGKAHKKYLYPSAGGKNAVQTYIYLKAWAVEGCTEGIYYYHPEQHRLYLINNRPRITADGQLPQNRSIFDQSSFSIFFIAQKAALEPIYLDFTPYLITLDAGYMAQLLTSRQSEYGIGLCPVSGLNFDSIASQFELDESHVFIHCLLGGYQIEDLEQAGDNCSSFDLTALRCMDEATLNRCFKELQQYGTKSKMDEVHQKGEFTYMSRREMVLFARQKLHLRRFSDEDAAASALTSAVFEPDRYKVRAAQREYIGKPIDSDQLGRFLSLLRPKHFNNRNHYLYPSFGALYAISVYLYIENNAVRNLREGLYRYDPLKHRLVLITSQLSNTVKGCHSPFNQKYYKESRFSIFLIADLGSSEATIGESAMHYALLEAGYIGQLLMDHQAEFGLGICPIGGMNFDRIHQDFKLNSNQMLVHSFIGGDVDYGDVNIAINAFDADDMVVEDIGAFAAAQPAASLTDIAIIGLAGRYPGASSLEEFWENLKYGKSGIGEVPPDRWNKTDYYDPDRSKLKTYTKWGAFLDGIEQFDSLLFNISPAEAAALDPQERLCLESVWHCLESAGYTADALNRQVHKVGVFIGVMWSDHQNTGIDAWRNGSHHLATSFHSSIANRISHFFDFNGPSMAVDTSCSSAATAIHLACDSIKHGECAAAVVAGVNVIGHPYHKHLLCRLNLLSADEKCRSFSADGDGWVVGEGVGTILIRPHRQAEQSNDHIMGLIKGSAISHSGRTARYGAPSVQAQVESISSAIENAHVAADSIDYVETAAPGSLIADSTEMEALIKVLGKGRTDQKPILIGSVKPNIGHLESASMMSQLTKVLLQFAHGQIAPTLHSSPLNPLIRIENTSFKIVDRLHQWNRNGASAKKGSMRVLINAFGATGSSGHLIVDACPLPEVAEPMASQGQEFQELIVLSAADKDTLRKCAANLHRHLTVDMGGKRPKFSAIARTLQTGRCALEERLAIVAVGVDEIAAKLDQWLDDEKTDGDIYRAKAAAGAGKSYETDFGGNDRKVDWRELAAEWVHGAIVKWEAYHPSREPKVLLPLYPFAASNHQVDVNNKAETAKPSPSPENKPATKNRVPLTATLTQYTENYLKGLFAHVSEIPIEKLDSQKNLAQYGLNSLMIEQLNLQLEKDLGEGSVTLFFEYPTVAGLAQYLVAKHKDRLSVLLKLPMSEDDSTVLRQKQALLARPVVDRQVEHPTASAVTQETVTDIAVIGMSGRYPQAATIEAFWQNLAAGKDCIIEIPEDRWDHTRFFSADRQQPGSVYSKWGGFIDGVDEFDPVFFHISPLEAKIMDPQERLFLEVAWETLEDAGYNKNALARIFNNQVGVFVGAMHSEYHLYAAQSDLADPPIALSSGFGSIANRVSYTLGFYGPSMAVDTMCSSSSTALHLAVESLKRRECRAALVGGVNLSLHPSKYIMQCQINMSSSDGRCRSFGKGGDGFVPGEGVGAVFIKPLPAAVRDNDHIFGIIKATTVNHGGCTSNYTVPSPHMQKELILAALAKADIDPRTISCVEAHGTGTSLGDPIEITGLTQAYGAYTNDRQFCSIGSVKSNIGHLEGAAGIAGLTKVLLQMKYRTLVPSLHAQQVNPNITFAETPFSVQQKLQHWAMPVTECNGKQMHHPRRAGISAFGAGGANVHVIIEEHIPAAEAKPAQADRLRQQKPKLVLLSAQTPERLKVYARRLLEFLHKHNRRCVHPDDLSLETVTDTLVEMAADILKVDPGDLEITELLENIGLDNYCFVGLKERLAIQFPAKDPEFEYDKQITLQALADGLLDRCRNDTTVAAQQLKQNALDLEEIAYTLQVGREHMSSRLAMIVCRVDELVDQLTHFLNGTTAKIFQIYNGETDVTGDIAAILTDGMEGRQFCRTLLENENYDKIARLWTMGLNFDWQMLYEDYLPQRISLPTYPFERKRFWFEPVPSAKRPEAADGQLSGENQKDISENPVIHVPPGIGDLQKQLKTLLADLLHLAPKEISGSRNLRDYGMDSVIFMHLCNAIQVHGYHLKSEDFHQTTTLNDLAGRLTTQKTQTVSGAIQDGGLEQQHMEPDLQTASSPFGVALKNERSNDSFALAFEQQRYFDLEQVNDINANLIIPFAFHLKGELDKNALDQSIRMIVTRHKSLRVVFRQNKTHVLQTVVNDPLFQIETHDLQHLDQTGEKVRQIIHETLHTRFDLSKFPLFRVVFIKLAQDEHILVFNMHHIIFDAASIFLFSNELFSGYLGLKHNKRPLLPPLQDQFDNYVVWEQDQIGNALAQRRAYWRGLFKQKAFGLNLPYDQYAPAVKSTADPETVTLDAKTVQKVHTVAKRLQITPYHVYLTALAVTLYGYTENPNLLIGTPLTNRKFQAAETMIGLLANLSVTVIDVADKPVFEELLKRTAVAAGNADGNQMPYQMLLNLLQQERTDPDYLPIQVAMNYFSLHQPAETVKDLNITYMDVIRSGRGFDLFLSIFHSADREIIRMEYADNRFSREKVLAILAVYKKTLVYILDHLQHSLQHLFDEKSLGFQPHYSVCIASTFSDQPLNDTLQFWSTRLERPLNVSFAPYNQIFQQLLQTDSLLASNHNGLNVLLVRLEDWCGADPQLDRQISATSDNLTKFSEIIIQSVQSRSTVFYLIGICPDSPRRLQQKAWRAAVDQLLVQLEAAFKPLKTVHLLKPSDIIGWFEVASYHDESRNRLGHIPYTDDLYISLATLIARQCYHCLIPPTKVIVLDCDNTLWKGIAGEDGLEGIEIDDAHLALQQRMLHLQQNGMLLCLCSKNTAKDVWAVFQNRPEMLLKPEHIAAAEINWNPKSENIRALARQLNLGLDSFVFIDDNPVEIEQVKARCPEVISLQLPQTNAEIYRFLKHSWGLEKQAASEEDKKRTDMYQQNIAREQLLAASDSFKSFIDSLNMEIEIRAMKADELGRVSQLTFRTNQFNTTTIRRDEKQIEGLINNDKHECMIVRVKDRFGDYGVVGVVIYTVVQRHLTIDTFLLSCRVLGKGVEHAIAARLGRIAAEKECGTIQIPLRPSDRNRPMRDFLDAVASNFKDNHGDDIVYTIPVDAMKAIRFQTKGGAPATNADKKPDSETGGAAAVTCHRSDWHTALWEKYGLLANLRRQTALCPVDRPLANLSVYTAPKTEAEKKLCQDWTRIMKIEMIGVDWNLFDLGPDSLAMVRFLAQISETFDIVLNYSHIIQHPTLAELARYIDQSISERKAV